ncbi:MAG: NAD(P)/FAD-dependent oxidoreductase [Deltaproteobacteria bacterium]|nr:NAD(P)/FAD-dependent oxidoreductase [Deltaproteobacteria bacterium]
MHDVLIVGGGPAGLHAATCLARRGWAVAVCEEHSAIGEPVHCTGILATEAFSRFALPTTAILADQRATRFHSPAGYALSYQTDAPEAVLIDRRGFDRSLADQARASGARILLDARVTQVQRTPASVVLSTTQGEVSGKLVILATGAAYHLHRSLGLPLPTQFIQTAQAEADFPWSTEIELYFGTTVAPGAFAWVVPFRDNTGQRKARIGLMATKEAEHAFARFVRSAPVAARMGASQMVRLRRRPIPLVPLARTFATRTLVVGDAAGLTKPTTGGGIFYSLLSAELAVATAQQALVREDYSEELLASYEREWKARCGNELRLGRWFRRYAERLTDSQIDEAFQLATAPAVDRLIREQAAFNSHGGLILALARSPQVRNFLVRFVFTSGTSYLHQLVRRPAPKVSARLPMDTDEDRTFSLAS